jgi:AcrR family transcriptional regulator
MPIHRRDDARRPYHHGNLKSALVAAGVDILEEEGTAGLTLRAIAARVGVSHTAPKNHFRSLRSLLTAIAAEGFRRHHAFMRMGLSERSDSEARLRAAIEGYVRFAREHKGLFRLMFSDQHCDFDDAELSEAAAASYAVLSEIAAGLDWDKADEPNAQRRAEIMLWSFVHGYAQLANAGLLAVDPQDRPDHDTALGVTDVMPTFSYRPKG